MMESQLFMNSRFIVLDIGNSRSKLKSDDSYYNFDYSNHFISNIENFLNSQNKDVKIIYSSVNQKVELDLLQLFRKTQISAINIRELISLQELIDISKVRGAGSDRILGLIGAWTENNQSFTTIDFGTATTINFVDNNVFIGGAILPGGNTMLKSVAGISKKLAPEQITNWIHKISKDTKSAVNSGLYLATIGGIEKALEIAKINNEKVIHKIYATGGLSSLFATHIDNYPVEIRPNLVIEGIEKLITYYL